MTESNPKRAISRRTLVKGAAWSVPVIAAAAASPAQATSLPPAQIVLGGQCSPKDQPQFFFFVTQGTVTAGSTFTISGPYQDHFLYTTAPAGAYSFSTTADGTSTLVTLNIDVDPTTMAPTIFLAATSAIPQITAPTTIDYAFATGEILPAGSNPRQTTNQVLLSPNGTGTSAACG